MDNFGEDNSRNLGIFFSFTVHRKRSLNSKVGSRTSNWWLEKLTLQWLLISIGLDDHLESFFSSLTIFLKKFEFSFEIEQVIYLLQNFYFPLDLSLSPHIKDILMSTELAIECQLKAKDQQSQSHASWASHFCINSIIPAVIFSTFPLTHGRTVRWWCHQRNLTSPLISRTTFQQWFLLSVL